MNLLDIFEGREPHQQAIDRLEQARIEHLEEKMDYYAKHGMAAEFKKAKEERDSYLKVQDECMGYGTLVGEGQMKHMMHKDAERMERAEFMEKYGNEEWVGEFWDNVNGPLDEAGIGHDIVNKTEKMARATPQTKTGAVASTVKNAAKWLAGKGGPGKEGPTYESQKKNSEDPKLSRLKARAHHEYPQATNDEALALHILDKEQSDVDQLSRENDREDRMIAQLRNVEQNLQQQIDNLTSAEVDEGWSDAIVAQRTGRPRTPYSVYIKGKKWKDFENEDHAENVANKLRVKFKSEGKDPSAITIAPTDYDKDIKEARRVRGGDYQLKLVDRKEDDDTDLDDVVTDYYFDVYQNGQKVGHAQGDSYYGELVVKADFNREFKLDTFHDKDHPLIRQFEKIQQQLSEGDDLGHLDSEVFGRIDAEKKRRADLKKNDPAAYARELEKDRKNYGRGIMGVLRRKYDMPLDEQGVAESATAPIIVPKRKRKEKSEPKFHIPYSADDYVPPAVQIARDEAAKKKNVKEFALGNGDDSSDDLTDEAFKDGQRLGYSMVDGITRARGFEASNYTDKYTIPFAYGWNAGRKLKIAQAKKDGVELTMKKDGSLVRGVAEDQGSWIVYDPETKQIKKRFKTHTAGKSYAKVHNLGFASSEYYFDNVKGKEVVESDSGDYDYPYTMSARDKGRYDAMTGREYNNPYSAFGTQEDHKNSIEYSAAYDSVDDEGVAEDQEDDWYDDEEESDLQNGSYVVDTQDPTSEVFRVSRYEPGARRCWIGDRNNQGWYISPDRLEIVDDPDEINRYFGKKRDLDEEQDTSGVESAIIRRIMVAHTDLLKQFGPQKVMQAAEEVAYNVGDVDEIGTSDVSAYVQQVRQILGA